MSHSKNYDNNKNNVQSKTNPVEDLNEILSIENASVERILSRIDQTPINEIKQRLKQHLDETFHQKIRLERIITELGGKPTDVKANLPTSNPPATFTMRKNLTKTTESKNRL